MGEAVNGDVRPGLEAHEAHLALTSARRQREGDVVVTRVGIGCP